MFPPDQTPSSAPPADLLRAVRRFPMANRPVSWLLIAILAPVGVWVAGRVMERLWLGSESSTSPLRTAPAARQKLEQQYRALFDELSRAAETAARRPDLVRTAHQPESHKALFELAVSAADRLRASEDRAALTIYDRAGEPLGWAGHPTDRPDVQSLPPGFHVIGGPSGVRLVHVVAMIDGSTRIGTVVAERALASGREIRNRYLENFDFTVTAVGLPVEVTYFTGETANQRQAAAGPQSFVIRDPSGHSVARVTVPDRVLEPDREYLRGIVRTVATAAGLVGLVGLALALRRVFGSGDVYRAYRLVAVVAMIWLLRLVTLRTNFPFNGPWSSSLVNPEVFTSELGAGLLRSPADFGLTGAAVLATAIAATVAFEWLRRIYRHHRLTVGQTGRGLVLYSLVQLLAALLVIAVMIGYDQFIASTVAASAVDLLHFSFHPWSIARLVLQIGFVAFHAAVALILVLVFRLGLFIARRPVPRHPWLLAQLGLWITAIVLAQALLLRRIHVPFWPSIIVYSVLALSSYYAERLSARIRRGTASVRLVTVFGAALLPSLMFYFSTTHYSEDNKRRLVESQPAQQVLRLREHHMSVLQQSLKQIDLLDLSDPAFAAKNVDNLEGLAFRLWTQTDLAVFRLTSAIEIRDAAGALLSRFALNLPSYRQRQASPMADLTWRVAEDAVAFASTTQRVMDASRGIYQSDRLVGTIAVRVAHDYDTLPFISSHNPYFELFRSTAPEPVEAMVMRDIELSVSDRQPRAIYTSTRPALPVDPDLLRRIQHAAGPFWITANRGEARDDVFVFWDTAQIYMLGYPLKSAWESFVDIAELTVLVGASYIVGLLVLTLYALASGRHEIWPMRLPGEVRASFYGKLLLGFVAASTVPMVILSLSVHAQFKSHIRAEEETAAQTDVTVAKRVVEAYEGSGRTALVDDDDVMVLIRALVEQDVNVFTGGRLVATSQRDLFAAGLLPPLAPGPLYQSIALDRADQYVGDERIGSFSYMVAAAPVRFAGRDGILTVPLALRQREIDSKIDELDRGVLLVTLVFVLGAATLGYWTAERLAAPIGRLTRATRRLAKGDFQTLPVITPGDEIQRLVGAFNRMAVDLEAQRLRLEQTARVEASAEMARRVAHDIKNPLTPVQLSAEHLLRVAADQGHAPRSVVEVCAENILRQVRMLRQIATEFSTFGTAPVPQPESCDVLALLEEVALSYRSGLDNRVELVATAPPDLPRAFADRVLVARALTNLVENALHAIPDRGRILLRGEPAGDGRVAIEVIDTGSGIEPEVLKRIFEPYFSTRTGGTGLGMAIVKRNIEANGGAIEVTSTLGTGTCVRIVLPAASDR